MILAVNFNNTAWAQLSPGPLSRPHAHLEGLKKCSSCHKLGTRAVGPKCLECHEEIAAMRQGSPGMHNGDDFSECVDCHVEHQGEDYDLIYWPDGPNGFDHRTVGFEKSGKHADLDCRQCHNAKFVADASGLKSQGKDLGRTYLGLEAGCAFCHDDVHMVDGRDATPARACTDCHDTNAWKPAPFFAHDKTAFPLEGKHQTTSCAKCHVPAVEETARVFSGLAHGNCSDCHRDPHAGALGPDCRKCHTTDGWLLIQGDSFDHSRTAYPLLGRHASVACAGCHSGDRKKPPFAACSDCHGDAHLSAALDRPELGRCEDCHTVAGFRPAGYPLAKHTATAFPLVGAHQAIRCNACHGQLGEGPYPQAANLAPGFAACTDCHQDPHLGHTDKYTAAQGCLLCHDQNGWREVKFDHALTGFVLDGRHSATACLACHPPAESGVGFRGSGRDCGVCHEDVHRGQFADKLTADGQAVACDRCHVTTDWLAEKFDHDRDSRFALQGGHERVACTVCHLPVDPGNDRLLHFKPLPIACRDCHANVPGPEGEDR